MVKYIANIEEFNNYVEMSKEKLVVIDFTADWCGPCKMIAPILESLSEEFEDVLFLKADVDRAADVAAACDIKCMPTFQFFKGGVKITELTGADPRKLKQLVEENKD
mmetsp:Transcript_11393/g.24044  ORF Transcript_11393/g.24044 Transcript_11393/m.24044 type:complete len:107 (-) Transcript_11393:906-1226(-)